MDRAPPPLFRQAAVEAASGTQIGAALTTHWRGVTAFTVVAFALLAALFTFVAVVEYSPVHRVAAFVDARGGLIAPQGDRLIVKLLVAPAAVASVRPGVEFKLAFRAYPRERFGLFAAKIESVSEVPSLPGELAQAPNAGEPMFVATAPLPGALHGPHGEVLPLKAGMLADALVPSERRTVLAWLLDPILRGLDDSVGRVPRDAGAEARR